MKQKFILFFIVLLFFFKGISAQDSKIKTAWRNEKGEIISPEAEIKNNEVVLHLNKNEKIIKVLYAYQPFTRANLENEAGLPASTFSIELK